MSIYYIEAYDGWNNQILGNLDGQGIIRAKNYKRTKHYKSLSTKQTLQGKVKYYHIVTETGKLIETIKNNTYKNPIKDLHQ